MGDALKGQELRDAQDEMVSRIVIEQKARGMVPNVSAAEQFCLPITEKISRDADDLDRRGIVPKAAPVQREGLEVTSQAMGTVDLATGRVSPELATALAFQEGRRESFPVLRGALRGMRRDPSWKPRMDALYALGLSAIEFERRASDLVREYLARFGTQVANQGR